MIQLNNAIDRGFKTDYHSITKKIQEELEELMDCKPAELEISDKESTFKGSTLQNVGKVFFTKEVVKNESVDYLAGFFELNFKDTEIGELGDIITTCITRLQALGIDYESLLNVINFYNTKRAKGEM